MVLDGRGLTDAQMQAFAKETNLSETTFILPRTTIECERGVRVRVFTIEEELPFAGHPTLGTAFVLRGASGAREIKLDLNVGPVPVRFKDFRTTCVRGDDPGGSQVRGSARSRSRTRGCFSTTGRTRPSKVTFSNPTTEELLKRAEDLIHQDQEYLKDFSAALDQLQKRQEEFHAEHPAFGSRYS